MSKLARIHDGVVAELLTPIDGFALEDCFAAEILADCVQAPNSVQVGWLYNGERFIAPPTAPALSMADLVAYAADRRWQREIGGIVVEGVPIATDDRSKLMITGARVAAAADSAWSTVWHGADGNAYPIDAAAMIAISDQVQAHVNSTFQAFAAIKAAIDAGEITTTAEIDESI